MKSILISIRPEWVIQILNGEKTIEIRKTAPKCDLPIDVYIYCTKAKNKRKFTKIIPPCVARRTEEAAKVLEENGCTPPYRMIVGRHCFSDGKVVAKFRLRKVKEFDSKSFTDTANKTCVLNPHTCEAKSSGLSWGEIRDYCKGGIGYAWHISDLEIFDEPKELGEFSCLVRKFHVDGFVVPLYGKVAKAPQSWRYVEVEE